MGFNQHHMTRQALFLQWWQVATSAQQRKAAKGTEDQDFSIHTHGSDNFGDFLTPKPVIESSQQQLAELLGERCLQCKFLQL